MICLNKICAKYYKNTVLESICLDSIPQGSIIAVIGPNGSGKSTMLKCIAGIHPVCSGTIYYKNKDISTISPAKLAQDICYMPQNTYSNASLSVFEVTLLAKKFANGGKVNNDDIDQVSHLLEVLNIDEFASRYISDLSGGQRQMVTLAQAIIRYPSILLLDEPTSALDLNYQIEALDLIQQIISNSPMICFIALHDLSLAGRYADYIMVLKNGKISCLGSPQEIMNKAMIEDTYKVYADIENKDHGRYVLPYESVNQDKNKWDKIKHCLSI